VLVLKQVRFKEESFPVEICDKSIGVSQDSMAGSTESRRSPVRRNMKKSYGLAALFKFVVDISTKYPCSSACPSLLLDL